MKRYLTVLVLGLFAGLFPLLTPCTLACKCAPSTFDLIGAIARQLPPEAPLADRRAALLKDVDAVFSGKVEKTSGNVPRKVTFKVTRVWKGPKQEKIVAETAFLNETCGWNGKKGEEYLVYAIRNGDALFMGGPCSGPGLLSNSKWDLEILGEGEFVNLPAKKK